MNKEYSTTLDLTTRTITIVAVALLLGTAGFNSWRLAVPEASVTSRIVYALLALMMVSILAGTWAFRVVGYTLERESFIIRRPIGNRRYPLREILKVIVPPTGTMRWSLRMFGNGGIFGFTGYYTNTTFGSMRWFATRTNNYVILQLRDGTKIVVTPDDIGLALDIRERASLPAV